LPSNSTRSCQAPQLLLADRLEQRPQPAALGDRLEHDLQRPAAGQPPARRLLVAHAVGDELRALGGDRLGAHLLDQVVLDAAARDRADHLPVVPNDHHRTDRPGRRAPGLDDGAERYAATFLAPGFRRAQYFDIDAVHGLPRSRPFDKR
jgi:hypothetical protein